MSVDLNIQIGCIEREIRMRDHVYPRRIAEGKMSQYQMDREMEAIRAVLVTLIEKRDEVRKKEELPFH